MKNKQILLIGLTALISSGFACTKPSSREIAEEFGKKMCYKMAECAQEQMKNMPAEQRQMAMGMMPSREKCDAAQKTAQADEKDNVKELTSEQIDQAQKCMAAMEKIPCGEMQKGVPECQGFSRSMH